MKISVNLATPSSLGERYALAWAVPLALFGALGLVFLARSMVSNLGEYQKVQQKLDAEMLREKALTDREAALRKDLDQPGQKAVFQKAHFVNGLIVQKQFSVTAMTQRVSKLMPESVRLISLRVARPKADISIRFSVVSHDEEGLEKFVENLEDAADFTDLNVANQTPADGKSMTGLVGINCSVRYVGDEAK
ncbi:MAG TPA: hypothetical protein VG028_00660 [Terriglobia bacterium]|nr:hypothetical protein [Terriglobia bacterium]